MSRPDDGQATIEFALACGLLALVVTLAVQLLATVHGQLEVDLLAREAARAASRADDPYSAARDATHVIDENADVDVTIDDLLVEVTVRRDAPLVARLGGFAYIDATVVMALEPP